MAESEPAQKARRVSRREAALLVAILLLAAGLRLWGLGSKSFWVDEILAVERSRSLRQARLYCTLGHEPPLRYYLLHYLARFNPPELACRLPSYLLGVATVALLWLLVRRLFGIPVAVVAAFLLAISPWHIVHSQDARMYAVMMFLWVLSLLLFYGALERPQQALYWPALAVVHALNFYISYLTVFVLLAQVLTFIGWLVARKWRERGDFALRPYLTGTVIFCGFFGIALRFWFHPLQKLFQRYFALNSDEAVQKIHAVYEKGRIDWPAEFDATFLRALLDDLLASAMVWRVLAVIGLSVGLSLCWRRNRSFVWIAALSFFLAIATVLFTEMRHFLATRYVFHLLLFAIVAFAMAIVSGAEALLARARSAGGRKAVAVVLSAVAAVTLYFYVPHVRLNVLIEQHYWKAACEYLADHAQPGDPILTGPWGTHLAVLYYGHKTLARRHRIANCLTVDTTEREITDPTWSPTAANDTPTTGQPTVWYITWGGTHLPEELRLVVEDKMDRVLELPGRNGTIEIFRRRAGMLNDK